MRFLVSRTLYLNWFGKKEKGTFLSNTISSVKEYIYVYSKEKEKFNGLIGEINHSTETYPCVNASNKREIRTIPKGIVSKYRESNYFMKKGSVISASTMDLVLHTDLIIKDSKLAEDLKIEGTGVINKMQ
jgi:adenine-specific DNA-methyltransferase